MIVYIASYPKSGNTWVRAILRTLTSSKLDINNINLGVNSASKKFTGTVVDSNIIKINKIVRYTRYKKYVDTENLSIEDSVSYLISYANICFGYTSGGGI